MTGWRCFLCRDAKTACPSHEEYWPILPLHSYRLSRNAALSGLENAPIRYIVDDCKKFVEREIRRGNKYDAIIMDPPSYGRGPSGEIWKLEKDLYPFLQLVTGVLSDDPLFVIINSYTTGLAPSAVGYAADVVFGAQHGGKTTVGELGLPVKSTGIMLPCGSTGRWTP